MMSIDAILVFFIMIYCFGYSVTFFLKRSSLSLEDILMNLGIGLGVFPIIATIFTMLRIPLSWWIFLGVGLIVPVYSFFQHLKQNTNISPQFNLKERYKKLTKYHLYVFLVILIAGFSFYTNHKGAFSYPWLEDDDPWIHAMGVSYISEYRTALEPVTGENAFQYLDAYPVAYDVLMSLLHQISSNMIWTLKFFNALLIALGFISLFFFVREFTRSDEKALWSTFILAMLPSYLTHFIWAHVLIIINIFPLLYSFEKTRTNHQWWYVSLLLVVGIFLVQPDQPIKIIVMIGLYWLARALLERSWHKYILLSSFGGFLVSFLVWWGPMLLKYKSKFMCLGLTQGSCGAEVSSKFVDKGVIGALGGATRKYTFNDFFIAEKAGLINNSVGIGIVVFILVVIALIVFIVKWRSLIQKEQYWKLVTVLWFIFTVMGLYGGTVFPVALFTFRFWMLFSIPVALLGAEAIVFILEIIRCLEHDLHHYLKQGFFAVVLNKIKPFQVIIIILLVFGIWHTSGLQRYSINTSMWPFNAQFSSFEQINGYNWMKDNIGSHKNVFPLCDSAMKPLTYDKQFTWNNASIAAWKRTILSKDSYFKDLQAGDLRNLLVENNFDYLVLGYSCIYVHGLNETQKVLNELMSIPDQIILEYQGKDGLPFIFKIQ
ncbi:hypothetical protein HYY69_05310 [Candidatus Woesearchaeota archaeon]|nr:hypothetical protein [Candidatus Woesearchaeota archaeon]